MLKKLLFFGFLTTQTFAASVKVLKIGTTGTPTQVSTSDFVPLTNGGTGTSAASANAAFNALSPLTTKGDVCGYSTVNARIPIGSDGQVLTADSAQTLGLKWAAATASIAIGSPVTSGTSGSILYVDGSGNLAQDNTNFNWTDSTQDQRIGLIDIYGTTVTAPGTSTSLAAGIGLTSASNVTWGMFTNNHATATRTAGFQFSTGLNSSTGGSGGFDFETGTSVSNSTGGFTFNAGTTGGTQGDFVVGVRNFQLTNTGFSTAGVVHNNSSGVFSSSLIVNADVSSSAAIAFSKLAALTSAHILVGNGSAVATDVALSGDATLANTGAMTLATVNSNVGTFGSASLIPSITVNGKGLITAVTTNAVTVVSAPPTVQRFTSGSGTYNKDYTFVITSGSATVGATYTNNAVTFTVYATVSSATQVVMSGSGAPASSGTLTKASGTGDATLTFSQFLAPSYIEVIASGGGGGGEGMSTATTSAAGSDGGDTTFGSSLITAAKGKGANGSGNGFGGQGGTVSVSSPAVSVVIMTGGQGTTGNDIPAIAANGSIAGGIGGSNALGGAGSGLFGGVNPASNAGNAAPNTGAGGGGSASCNALSAGSKNAGSGGGSAGYVDAIIVAPSATYSYAVGASGSGGTGTCQNGGNGGSGVVTVKEFFQ